MLDLFQLTNACYAVINILISLRQPQFPVCKLLYHFLAVQWSWSEGRGLVSFHWWRFHLVLTLLSFWTFLASPSIFFFWPSYCCSFTFSIDSRYVGPAVSLDNVNHRSCLLSIRRHHPHKVLIKALKQWKSNQWAFTGKLPKTINVSAGSWSHLITEVHTGGRIGNLRYIKQL